MGVLAIWRYPVKAMVGELLDAVEIGLAGCAGDRRWVVADADTGERIANKRGPTHAALRACRAEVLDDSGAELPLRVTLPDGSALEGRDIKAAVSELLGRSIRLEPFEGDAAARLGAPAAYHDFAPLHVMTTRTLAHLHAVAPESDWDVRRFRPNLVLDDGAQPGSFSEDALYGRRMRAASGLELRIELPTPRCVVPTRATEELPRDPRVLRTVVEQHRIDLGPFGRPGCAGAYAVVASGGRLAVRDTLTLSAASSTAPSAIVQANVARLVAELAQG